MGNQNRMDWGGVDLIVRSIRQSNTPGQDGAATSIVPTILREGEEKGTNQPTPKTEEPVAAKEPKAKRSWM